MAAKGTETVIRLRATGAPGRHGAAAPAGRVAISFCHVIPRTSSEDSDDANTVIVGLTLVAPGGTDLKASDRIEYKGLTYEIEGEPGDYMKRGRSKAVIAGLRRVTG